MRKSFLIGLISLSLVILAGGWLFATITKPKAPGVAVQTHHNLIDGSLRKMRSMAFWLSRAGAKAPFGPVTPQQVLDNPDALAKLKTVGVDPETKFEFTTTFDTKLNPRPLFTITKNNGREAKVTYIFGNVDDATCASMIIFLAQKVQDVNGLRLQANLDFKNPPIGTQRTEETGGAMATCEARVEKSLVMSEEIRLR